MFYSSTEEIDLFNDMSIIRVGPMKSLISRFKKNLNSHNLSTMNKNKLKPHTFIFKQPVQAEANPMMRVSC